MNVQLIIRSKFHEDPSKGFRALRPRKTAFPIDFVHRPYNSVGTTVPQHTVVIVLTDERHHLQVTVIAEC